MRSRIHPLPLIAVLLTAAACGGGGDSAAGLVGSGGGPQLSGDALYYDVDLDGRMDAGDRVLLFLDCAVSTDAASAADFALSESTDRFGTGATVIPGPRTDQLSVVLGTDPRLRLRGSGPSGERGASRIDVAGGRTVGIRAEGLSARPGQPVRVVPGFQPAPDPLGVMPLRAAATRIC